IIKNENRVRYFKKPKTIKKGAPASRNYGLTKSNGVYVNWFDSDDLMHPKKLETDLKYITSGNYDFTISQSDFFMFQDEPKKKVWNDNLWSPNPINDFIIKKIGWGINSPLWKKESIKKVSLEFNGHLTTGNDYLYHIQALEFGLTPVVINETLVSQRIHSHQLRNHPFKAPS